MALDLMKLYTSTYFMMYLVIAHNLTAVLCLFWIVNMTLFFFFFTYIRPAVYNYSSSDARETVCYCGLCHYLCFVGWAVSYCYQKHWDGLQLLLGSRGWNDLPIHCWHGELNEILESFRNCCWLNSDCKINANQQTWHVYQW